MERRYKQAVDCEQFIQLLAEEIQEALTVTEKASIKAEAGKFLKNQNISNSYKMELLKLIVEL